MSNNKTKILHISSHGYYEGTYFLVLENLMKNGQIQKVNYNKLKYILNSNIENIKKMDLVFVSTCHSQDLGELFLECGAKNVIFIHRNMKIIDNVIIKFSFYFYQNLIIGNSIKKSYQNAIESMKIDKEILNILQKKDNNKNNKNFCDIDIDYTEILKIMFKSINDDYINVSSFNLNEKGKLSFNSNIKFYYDEKKFTSILGRNGLMGKIFNNITKNGNYVFLYGEKGLEKIIFAESLCVYLCERKIINDYKIYKLNSENDFNFMINEINKTKNKKFIEYNKKNVKIIKFAFSTYLHNIE